jgi:hypothetical protein
MTLSRRQLLSSAAHGFGMLALGALMNDRAYGGEGPAPVDPLAPKKPHFPAKAKRVIFLFMGGGVSHVDTFDPKPLLEKYNGQDIPLTLDGHLRQGGRKVFASPWTFQKYGRIGMDVSTLFPEVAGIADDLCFIRSMACDNIDHNSATFQLTTGEQTFSRPSMGSWVLYGLGSENRDLPGFISIAPTLPQPGTRCWGSSFLPAAFQGARVKDMKHPIADLDATLTRADQRSQLDLIGALGKRHAAAREADSRLDARLASFELAFRMQKEAPDAFDLTQESKETEALYGIDQKESAEFGRQCLLARRLAERGVRFIHVDCGSDASSVGHWDQHGKIKEGHTKNAKRTDRPVAGLIKDLKQRGLLDDTLVVWATEFGRTPTRQGPDGREHHPHAFTMWMAGGGVKRGHIHGATDEWGWNITQDRVHIHDLHATILHLLGLDHERLTYRFSGRDYRLTDVHGHVVKALLA